MKEVDSSLIFPLLMKALERCVSPRVYTIYKFFLLEKFAFMAIYHRIDQDILSWKSLHKDTPISVLFFTFLLGKLPNSVDPQGNMSSYQGLRQQLWKLLWKYMPVHVPLE